MGSFYKKTCFSIFILISLFVFSSCEAKNSKRVDISNSIEYIEAPPYYSVDSISQSKDFKHLPKEKFNNLNSILQNKENYIWLKINFTIPRELKYKDLGLFIGRFKTADRVWINMIPCGSYGKFPPNELSAGFGSQHFTFNSSSLYPHDVNTIYIQAWTGCDVTLSDKIFISNEFDAYQAAERSTFFTSRIILCFACISCLAAFIYLFLFLYLRKFSVSKTYLIYSLLLLFSVVTLLPFCLYEIPWLKPQHLSYFTIMKILLTIGICSTIFFVNIFMVSFIKGHENKIIKISRCVLCIIPIILTLNVNSYEEIPRCIHISLPILLAQFIFTSLQIISAVKDEKRRNHIIQLSLSLIPAIVGFIIDISTNSLKNLQVLLPIASIYGWQITTYIFVIHLLKRFSDTYSKNLKLKNDMVKFNAKLENEVEIRTKELSEKNFILSRGLEAITLVQQEVLPKKNKTFAGWDISTTYIPLDSEVSGDLYDYYFTGNKLDGFSIIDVSGHGIPAGLMTILAKGIISQQYISGLENYKTLTQIMHSINQIYIQEKVTVENYFTGLLFNIDRFDRDDICHIQMVNAGHPAPLLYNSKTNNVSEIKYKNPEEQYGFIGVDGFPVAFPTTNFEMTQNDIIVCFTDGITEAMNKNKDEFTKIPIEQILKDNSKLSAEEIKNKIIEKLNTFLDTQQLSDDLTLIVLKRTNSKDYLEEI